MIFRHIIDNWWFWCQNDFEITGSVEILFFRYVLVWNSRSLRAACWLRREFPVLTATGPEWITCWIFQQIFALKYKWIGCYIDNMSIKSKKIAGNMRIKPVHILLAVPVWMAISIAVPLGTTVSLIILATLLICYFLLRILVSLERLRFDMRE